MKLGEFGVEFIFASGMDLTGATYLALVFTAPDGTELVKELPEISIGTAARYTPAGYLPGGTYASYVFANGDVAQSGKWTAKLIYQDAMPRKLLSSPVTFTIEV